ncbi:MAG: Oxidoreductase [Bryobacterales bacterium]|nr:Oxidoreductase [Bryobacterales bacterium]
MESENRNAWPRHHIRIVPNLFDPLKLRSVELRNRIGISPMCMYSSEDGFANDWHLMHLGARAAGGAGLVMVEATAVEARGRITPADMGIWKDEHIPPLARVARFVASQGAVPGIQIAHAGRKASNSRPWEGGHALSPAEGGWPIVGPSPIPFDSGWLVPKELTVDEIRDIERAFQSAAVRALEAGFHVVELHGAHGYLIHSFLSPLSNHRTDRYGGSFENRTRFPLETVRLIREVWPDSNPLFVRLSCSDWVEGGWTIDDSVSLAKLLKPEGVDLIDCSSGGGVPKATIPVGAGYQVPFAKAIRTAAGIPSAAVGLITEPMQADQIIRNGEADLILLARASLRNPNWPIDAARELHFKGTWPVPPQYLRML